MALLAHSRRRCGPTAELVVCAGSRGPSGGAGGLPPGAGRGAGLSVLVKTAENEAQLARCAPFTASYPVPEQGTVYYLCENGACQAPTRDFDRLPFGEPTLQKFMSTDAIPALVVTTWGPGTARPYSPGGIFSRFLLIFPPKSWSACGFLCKLRCIKIR